MHTLLDVHSLLLNFNNNLISFNNSDIQELFSVEPNDKYIIHKNRKIEVINEEINESQSINFDSKKIKQLHSNNLKAFEDKSNLVESFDKYYKYIIYNDYYNLFDVSDINYILLQHLRSSSELNSISSNIKAKDEIGVLEEYNFDRQFILEKPKLRIDQKLLYKSELILG